MSCSLCPHLVQEYFERVSDILTTYRPQILKQVEYDKISENLVLRGAVRPEEHQRIYTVLDTEGQVSQMLVVIQNRMWGLENLIAVFMEEHISPWLTQEMFRAYNEHLVSPLKHQRDNRICQCVRISNSVLYKGWVQTLKSLDTWILKTGTVLGFVNQTIYPTTDNMLAFLSDKLADYTGGDSQSANRTDLVPFGFAPNSSGEVQVAELEEDDINDLISLSETLCIGYPSSNNDDNDEDDDHSSKPGVGKDTFSVQVPKKISNEAAIPSSENKRPSTVFAKPIDRKVNLRKTSDSRPLVTRRRSSLETAQSTDTVKDKQRDLITRLSTPKSAKSDVGTTSAPSKSTPIRLRSIPSDGKGPASSTKPRPKSMEFHRSFSLSSSSNNSGMASSASSTASSASNSQNVSRSKVKADKNVPVAGKTAGYVRSKIGVPTSPKARVKATPNGKPTAVATPTMKSGQGKVRQRSNESTEKSVKAAGPEKSLASEEIANSRLIPELDLTLDIKYEADEVEDIDDGDDFPEFSTEMSSLFLSKTILSEEGHSKTREYYQLNFDD